jgi:hypothetical protein
MHGEDKTPGAWTLWVVYATGRVLVRVWGFYIDDDSDAKHGGTPTTELSTIFHSLYFLWPITILNTTASIFGVVEFGLFAGEHPAYDKAVKPAVNTNVQIIKHFIKCAVSSAP